MNFLEIFSKIINFILERLSYIGKAPLCNLNPEHGFCIMGFYFPLCIRCTGVLLGIIIGSLMYFTLFANKKYTINIHLTFFALLLPMILDGTIQYVFDLESTNFRRILTGLLFGIGGSFSALLFLKRKIPKLNDN